MNDPVEIHMHVMIDGKEVARAVTDAAKRQRALKPQPNPMKRWHLAALRRARVRAIRKQQKRDRPST